MTLIITLLVLSQCLKILKSIKHSRKAVVVLQPGYLFVSVHKSTTQMTGEIILLNMLKVYINC